MCATYTHLLAYGPAVPQSPNCEDAVQSVLATTDPFGNIWSAQQLYTPSGDKFTGSLYGLAVSEEHNTIWACGKGYGEADWSIITFLYSEVDSGIDGFDENRGGYTQRDLYMCTKEPVAVTFPATSGKANCHLEWDRLAQGGQGWLWVGSTVQPYDDDDGAAWAFLTEQAACAHDTTRTVRVPAYQMPVATMSYEYHVMAMSIFEDVLGDHYVGLARCDNFNRNQKPCQIDFFTFDSGRTEGYSRDLADNTPKLSIRVPTGIASLTHDTALNVDAYNGGYFHAAFVGLTSENVDSTYTNKGDLEDRIFTFVTPVLKNGYRKRADSIGLKLLDIQIIPADTKLLSFIPTRPDEDEDDVRNGLDIGLTAASADEDDVELNPDYELSEDDIHDASADADRRLLGTAHTDGMATLGAKPGGRGRRLSTSFEDSDCLSITTYLVRDYAGDSTASAKFGVDLGVIDIDGEFSASPTLVAGIIGDVCFSSGKVQLGLDFQIGIAASLQLQTTVAGVARGYLDGDGRALSMSFKPLGILNAFSGALGAQLWFALEVINLEFRAGIALRVVKICTKKKNIFKKKIKIKYPCGFEWGSTNWWVEDRITLGTGSERNLIPGTGDDKPDETAPMLGTVSLEQLNSTFAIARFASFTEEESEVVSGSLIIERPNGDIYHQESWEGENERWEGEMSSSPEHGRELRACVSIYNTVNLVTTACSEPIVWDLRAPILSTPDAFYLVNPLTGGWKQPAVACRDEYSATLAWPDTAASDGSDCRVFVNGTSTLDFAFEMEEVPDGGAFKSAMWALTRGSPCEAAILSTEDARYYESLESFECSEKLIASSSPSSPAGFFSIGYAQRLGAGDGKQSGLLQVRATDLALVNEEAYYINLHLCDTYENCAMWTLPYSLIVDATAPDMPTSMAADRNWKTAANGLQQYFIHRDFIQPSWTFAEEALLVYPNSTLVDVVDPQSGPLLLGVVNLYRLRPGEGDGREHLGEFQMTVKSETVPMRTPPWLLASDLVLIPSAWYVVELTLFNQAGSVVVYSSDAIKVDYTKPACSAVTLLASPGESDYFVYA